ncbi:MAG: hypothetical protein JWO96_74 [Candidatus Saccharibacteria bacterium]|nr:hypothetical protein [Candidatus Saccharibacteria bacterium]
MEEKYKPEDVELAERELGLDEETQHAMDAIAEECLARSNKPKLVNVLIIPQED